MDKTSSLICKYGKIRMRYELTIFHSVLRLMYELLRKKLKIILGKRGKIFEYYYYYYYYYELNINLKILEQVWRMYNSDFDVVVQSCKILG